MRGLATALSSGGVRSWHVLHRWPVLAPWNGASSPQLYNWLQGHAVNWSSEQDIRVGQRHWWIVPEWYHGSMVSTQALPYCNHLHELFWVGILFRSIGKVQGSQEKFTCMAVCSVFLHDWSQFGFPELLTLAAAVMSHTVWIPGLNIFTLSELSILCAP